MVREVDAFAEVLVSFFLFAVFIVASVNFAMNSDLTQHSDVLQLIVGGIIVTTVGVIASIVKLKNTPSGRR